MSALHFWLGRQDCRNDIGIGGAAAEIPTHILADHGLRSGMVDKCLLHRMKLSRGRGDAFYSGDLMTRSCSRQSQAGENAFAVDMDGAGAALPVIAAFLGGC